MAKKPTPVESMSPNYSFRDRETASFHPEVPAEVMAAIARLEDQDKLVNCDDGKDKCASAPSQPDWKVVSEHINSLHDRIEDLLKPLEFEYAHDRPLMVVKLGSSHNGWIPNARHFDRVRKVLKASGEDKKNNILLYHYGISIERNPSFTAS